MNCKKVVNIIILFIAISACEGQIAKIENSNLHRIDLKGTNEDSIEDYIEDFRYVKLETTADCIIANIDQLQFVNGIYHILDTQTKSIYLFDENGRYLRKIHRVGRGPEEYLAPFSMELDKDGNIYVLDVFLKTVFKYESNGAFLEKIIYKDMVNDILPMEDGKILSYHGPSINSSYEYKLILNENGHIVPHSFPIEEKPNKMRLETSNTLLKSSNKIFFHENYSDTIYTVTPTQVEGTYYLDFGELSLSQSERKAMLDATKNEERMRTKGKMIKDYYQNFNFFTCTYMEGGKPYSVYYSLKDGKTLKILTSFDKEQPKKVLSDFRPIGLVDEFFVAKIDPSMLNWLKTGLKNNKNKMMNLYGQKNLELINSVSEFENPVLVLYKL